MYGSQTLEWMATGGAWNSRASCHLEWEHGTLAVILPARLRAQSDIHHLSTKRRFWEPYVEAGQGCYRESAGSGTRLHIYIYKERPFGLRCGELSNEALATRLCHEAK